MSIEEEGCFRPSALPVRGHVMGSADAMKRMSFALLKATA
jgi:hypothetical protein